MLKVFPDVRRWEQTGDVLDGALLRLTRALEATKPKDLRHFYNLALLQIRRELIDLAKHHRGPESFAANHHTDGAGMAPDDAGGSLSQKADESDEPNTLEAWATFHEAVDGLPDEEREIVDLVWYDDLTQMEAAKVLCISLRTVKRRWQSARLKLAKALGR